jgi:hypothetical protein
MHYLQTHLGILEAEYITQHKVFHVVYCTGATKGIPIDSGDDDA